MNKNETEVKSQLDKNEKVQELYLSSILDSNNEIKEKEDKGYIEFEESEDAQEKDIQYYFKCITVFIITFLSFFVFIALFPLLLILTITMDKEYIIPKILCILSFTSITYTIIIFFFFPIENENLQLLLQDEVYFVFSSFLVFSYVKLYRIEEIVKKDFREVLMIAINTDQTLHTVLYTNIEDLDQRGRILDYNRFYINYTYYQQKNQFSALSNRFSNFTIKKQSSQLNQDINELFKPFGKHLKPEFKHYFILVGITLLKLIFIFIYFLKISVQMQTKHLVDITLIILVYLYITFSLNRILGNNDLRRKTDQMNYFNQFVDFSDVSQSNYKSKLDITCPISFETWDNARKCLLSYQLEYLYNLEIAYFCLVFYYFFMIVVCLSAFFDLDWLIPKDSTLLQPTIVIMSTFDFIFMTFFLLFRFQEGSKYNDSFQTIEESIIQLQDTVSDLDIMFNQFFFQKNKSQERRYSTHGLIIKRVKMLSKYYIENGIIFQDRKYLMEEKQQLRKKMIEDIKKSLKKIKYSIQSDKGVYNYKFINLFEVNIQDFLFTLTFGLITTLPTIVPKFISFYHGDKKVE